MISSDKEDLKLELEDLEREQEVEEFLKKEKEEDERREAELKKKEIRNAKDAAVRETQAMKEKLAKVKETSKRKGKNKNRAQNYVSIILLIILLGSLVALILTYFPISEVEEVVVAIPTCGDGTFYDRCSLAKPYYCAEGQLVENPIFCGCPDELIKDEGACTSKYLTGPETTALTYNLRGEESYLLFTTYDGVQSYLEKLPRSLFYNLGETPRRDDFKLMKIEDELQRELLLPLVVGIQNAAQNSSIDQLRIAVSLVQNIPYKESEFTGKKEFEGLRLSRYPYQVILEGAGSCEGKSELLSLILKELGYDSAMFYYKSENHEAVGIKCPTEVSLGGSGYCFVETTVPSPISYSNGVYLGISGGRLMSSPQIILLNRGKALSQDMYEFEDASTLDSILEDRAVDLFERSNLEDLQRKYGLSYLSQ